MTSSMDTRVSAVYPRAIPDSKEDHKLRVPRHHPGTDHPKEIPNIPTIVDRITGQHTPDVGFRSVCCDDH